jgi:hypothetical protein
MDGVFLGFGWGVWDEYLASLEYNLFWEEWLYYRFVQRHSNQ